MVKTIVAHTGEVDDAQVAVDEILSRLNLAANQRQNTVGIIACHYEFVLSGVAKAVCQALPFEVVGTITSAQAVRAEAGTLLLTLMVLTSDEVQFATQLSPSLLEQPGERVAETYRRAAAWRENKPALVLAYASFLTQNSGDEYVRVLTEVSDGVPCFGTLAVDDTNDFSNCFLLYGGQHYRDRMALLLLYGDIQPKFYTATLSPSKIMDKAALITKSEGHIVMEINGRPVPEYFADLGLTKASETLYAMSAMPFILDYGDGTARVSRTLVELTPEHYALCAGAMQQGANLYIGVLDKPDILLTSGAAVDTALADVSGASGFLVYSCIARNLALGAELLAELDMIRSRVGNKLPFMCAYSGGEICPSGINDGKAINRFHNNTFIACVF